MFAKTINLTSVSVLVAIVLSMLAGLPGERIPPWSFLRPVTAFAEEALQAFSQPSAAFK